MSYLTKIRALTREEDSADKLNKLNKYKYNGTTVTNLANTATKETNLTKNVLPGDEPPSLIDLSATKTKKTNLTKNVPAPPDPLDAVSAIYAKSTATPDTLVSPPAKVTLRCLTPITLTLDGGTIAFERWDAFTVLVDEAQPLLDRYPDQLERLSLPPSTAIPQPTRPVEPPLHPGWVVSYRDWGKGLCGGSEAGDKGIVKCCEWDGTGWMVTLRSGDRITLRQVTAVGKTIDGRLVSAWTVQEYGYDGEGPMQAEKLGAVGESETTYDMGR